MRNGQFPNAKWDYGNYHSDPEEVETIYIRDMGIRIPMGECWSYRLFVDGVETDSCYGFVGDIDDIKSDIASCLAPEWCNLVDKLELRCQSAKEYLYDMAAA